MNYFYACNKSTHAALRTLMKKLLLHCLLFFCVLSNAQIKGSQVVQWKAIAPSGPGETALRLPQFQAQHMIVDGRTLRFGLSVPVRQAVNESSLRLTEVDFETIGREALGDLDPAALPTDWNATLTNSNARGVMTAVLLITPIIKDAAGFKRLRSFSYEASAAPPPFSTARDRFSPGNSVLTSGDWYRFYVEKSGVYRISKSFLQSLGMKLGSVNPQNIKIYGNGGRMLPLSNAVDYPIDLTENAVYVKGGEDGSFDSDDYILFYAEGTDNWSQENLSHNNLYSDKSYYYVTVSGGPGKRIQPMPDLSGSTEPITSITEVDDYHFHEVDKTNIARMGRRWFGEDFAIDNEQSFDFELPDVVPGSQVNVSVTAAAAAFTNTSFSIKANGSDIGSISLLSLNTIGTEAADGLLNANFPAAAAVEIAVAYDNNGVPGSKAYLDYIILRSKRQLKGNGKQFRFRYNAAATTDGIGQYQVANATSISEVWDITDIFNVTTAVNNGQAAFSYLAPLGEVREYIAVCPQDYLSPKKEGQSKVVNQNLKGTIFQDNGEFRDIDYLIITPKVFATEAERLAAFHRTYSGLNVKVVNVESIYPEFSSGKQDIGAIRNFIRYVYKNASSDAKRVRYVNLFGDASFDFKNRIPNNTNFIPIYTATSSFSLSSTYISDDYFVLMDDNEGTMNAINSRGLDIAVGRMPVDDLANAREMVDKVLEYHDAKSYGRWRNNFVLISDDVDEDWEATLEFGLDELGDEIHSQKPFVNIQKIHADSYVQESSSGGERYPGVYRDFIESLNQGALVFNYFGHGGEEGLASERIFDKASITELTNRYKYPLFVTITCEFTRFDNPFRPTAGEELFWKNQSGAIALVTTTRQISPTTGQAINEAFSSNLYGYGTNDLDSIAEALRRSKSNYGGVSLMVFFIGDPALHLAIPKPSIVLTQVNDVSVTGPVDDFKALSPMKVSGEVRDETGTTLLSDYNGELALTVYDKSLQSTTIGNDGTTNGSGLILLPFTNIGETLFRGNATVTGGKFDVQFVVPRDIRIPVDKGRISFYAKKTGQLIDQTGYNIDINVGGINTNATSDVTGPTVRLYMNDESFVNGGITNTSPILLAILEDANGINTVSGIGHDIVGILDGDEANPYIMNQYYEAEADNYAKGRVRYPFKDLEPGLHTLTFKAWDVYNNPVTSEIQFVVVGEETLALKNVLNYPNPFVDYTEFWFTHNRPFEPLEVQVQVMTVTGKVVWTRNQTVVTDGFLSRDIKWDGRDDFGDRIGKGVYVYKLTVRSTTSGKQSEKFEKLVIL